MTRPPEAAWVALLAACSAEPVVVGGGNPTPVIDDSGDSGAPGDSGAGLDSADSGDSAVEPLVSEEGVGDYTADNEWIFDDTVIHRIDIQLSDDSFYLLRTLPYDWAPADVSIDGVPAPDVGVRLRGKIGSFRTVDNKPKWKIDFNQYREGRDFYGLEHLSLNNAIVDCSYLKEKLGYAVVGMAGLPTLRTAYADLYVNGVDYGLYLILETPDKRWLERNYPDPDGNLYDGKYLYDYTTGSYTLLDFTDSVDEYFQLEEGTDVGNADIFAITAANTAATGSGQYEALTAPLIDWDNLHAHLAVEQWIGHNDGYALNTNNYRVYFDPTDGLMRLNIWDLDYAFLEDSWWGMSWAAPRGVLASGCWNDMECKANQRLAVEALVNRLDPTLIDSELDRWDALTYDRAYNDPRRECSVDNVAYYRQLLQDWVPARGAYMKSAWGLP